MGRTTLTDCKVAASTSAWISEDIPALRGDLLLETCLKEVRDAGYEAVETGARFPRDPAALKTLIEGAGLRFVTSPHYTFFTSRPVADGFPGWTAHLEFLNQMDSPLAVVTEVGLANYVNGLNTPPTSITEIERKALIDGLTQVCSMAADKGVRVAYAPHIRTAIESEEEISRLLQDVPALTLAFDTAHAWMTKGDAAAQIRKFAGRISHVRMGNVRPKLLAQATTRRFNLEEAVRAGVFTVAGDDGFDFTPVFKALSEIRYRGWLVVRTEIDPLRESPFAQMKFARGFLRTHTGI